MAFSSATDPDISVLDYASRYEPSSPEFGAGDPTVFHTSESERAAMAARADDQLEDRVRRGMVQEALGDPGSVASKILEYPNKMKELSLLAQLDPVRAASETNKLERFILSNRGDIVRFSSFMGSADPLVRDVATNSYNALQLMHRRQPVIAPDGTQTTVFARTQEGAVPMDPASGLGFSDDVVSAYRGPDPFRKQLASLFIDPAMSVGKSPAEDGTIEQKRKAASFAIANADRLEAAFGKDGAIRLMSRLPAMQGTAGGVTHLASTFLDYAESQAALPDANPGEKGYARAGRLLDMYKELTDSMLQSTDRDTPYTDSEKRYAAISTIACMKAMPAADLSKATVRNAMRKAASLFARAGAYDVDLFSVTKKDGSSVASELGKYISDVSSGLVSDGWLDTVDRYFRSLDFRVRGSASSVPRPAEDTGDSGYYRKSPSRLRRQETPQEMPDWAASAAAAVEIRHILPRIRREGNFDAAWEALQSDKDALARFKGELSEAVRSTMGLFGADGKIAAGVLADEYVSKMGTPQPFLLEQAVTKYLYGKGSKAVSVGVRQALAEWYGYGVVEDAKYRDLSRKLMFHLTSPIGGGYTPQQAVAAVALTRNRAEQLARSGGDPSMAFQLALSKGTYYAYDESKVLDDKTGLPRDLDSSKDPPFKGLPDWRRVVTVKVDAPLPQGYWENQEAFMSSYRHLDRRYKELQSNLQANYRVGIRNAAKTEAAMGAASGADYYP